MRHNSIVRACKVLVASILVWSLASDSAKAQVCQPPATASSQDQTQAALKYLRRISLDLRGRVPSYAEYNKVAQQGYVDEGMLDGMLNSSLFLTQIRELFADLLTLNITDLRVQSGFRIMPYVRINQNGEKPANGESYTVVINHGTAILRSTMRGKDVHCLNEPAKYDAKGQILCKIQGSGLYEPCIDLYNKRQTDNKVGQEGYEMVLPYWEKDPTKLFKVCGMTAQKVANPKDANGKVYQCAMNRSLYTDGPLYPSQTIHPILCGCGPNLEWCFRSGEGNIGQGLPSMNTEVLESLMEQTFRFIEKIVREDRPYTDLLLAKDMDVNGPLSHFMTKNTRAANTLALPSRTEMTVPAIPYYETTKWMPVQRTRSRESGLLTLPFYLLKYATNRGRLHRYYNAFLCQYFTPPAGGLPDPTNACHQEPNLTQRCGCSHCHTTIEPGAAHWGRWQENAWFPLDPTAFPTLDPNCTKTSERPLYCNSLYMVAPKHDSETPYKGKLLSYVFATPTMESNIGLGPTHLVQNDIKNGNIAACGVQKMWSWFVGYDLQTRQDEVLNTLNNHFKQNNLNVRKLVKAIVMTEEYRRGYDVIRP